MHASRFNDLTRDVAPRSRRRFLGMITGFGGLLALTAADVAARCKKRCGSCKHCKNGKCKPKPEGTACAGGACQGGACLPTAVSPPLPPSAQADAFCPGPGNVSLGVISGNRLAQTFTANTRGWLVSVQVVLHGYASTVDDYIMRVATTDGAGFPTNTVLATTTVAANQVPDGLTTVTFTFPDPATVLPGRRYALVLTRPGDYAYWRAHDSDICATGSTFISGDGGVFYPTDHQSDCLFATFVTP